MSPASLLLLMLLAGFLCLKLGWQRLGRRLLGVAIMCLTLIACLPLDEWLAYPLEKRFAVNPPLPSQVDGIIVLGGAIDPLLAASWGQAQLNHAGERVLTFYQLARRYPDATLIYSGGSGSVLHQDKPEAEVARTLYQELGIAERILFENRSRNTHENALESRALAHPEPGQRWILITSASHMPRSVGIFCAQDWPVIAYPVDHESSPGRLLRVEFNPGGNLDQLSRIVREWIGLFAYYFTGKTTTLLPGDCT